MAGNNRSIFIVIAGLILAGASQPKEETPTARAQQEQDEPIEASPTASSEPYLPYPSIDDERCYKAKNHDTADLCAQWRAAIAAEKAAMAGEKGNWIAGFGAVFSLVSIVLILVALGQTRRANRLAERALHGLERPLLSIELTHHGTGVLAKPKHHASFDAPRFKVRNFGRAPAILKGHAASLSVRPFASLPIDRFGGFREVGKFADHIIGSGEYSEEISCMQHGAAKGVELANAYQAFYSTTFAGYIWYADLLGAEYVRFFFYDFKPSLGKLLLEAATDTKGRILNCDRKLTRWEIENGRLAETWPNPIQRFKNWRESRRFMKHLATLRANKRREDEQKQ